MPSLIDMEHLHIADDLDVSEDEPEDEPSGAVDKFARRKREQNQIFESWYRTEASKTDFTNVQVTRKKGDQQELETIRDLLRNRSGRKIINSPHAFQVELFERAKKENTVVVADTGSGKTLVSMLLLKHVMDEELESRSAGNRRKVAFFVVDKVALMWQQYDSLQANLRFDIGQVCGDTNPELWNEGRWTAVFDKHDIIVCTAQVLLDCLMRSFMKMENISLLIFDEAHHAKKGHAYARIMQEFYLDNRNNASRPRVFGMTASPVDVQDKDEIIECAKELETLLQCKIATCPAADMEEHANKPVEEIRTYLRCTGQPKSKLYLELEQKYQHLEKFKILFERARDVSRALGPWCGDAYWMHAFSDKAARKLAAREEQRRMRRRDGDDAESRAKLDKEVKLLFGAQADIQNSHSLDMLPTLNDISSKVSALREVLLRHFERAGETRCLVFVTKRETARLLHLLFDKLEIANLATGFLIGSAFRDLEGARNTFRQQQSTLNKFRDGKLNCLFATSVAEEGLDIPECNVVIRFDPCNTMIQYIQSRGRARQKRSRFIHLMEKFNHEEEDKLADIHESENLMKGFCNDLPRDRLIALDDDDDDEILSRKDGYQSFTIKSTGAKLTFQFSLGVLNHYVSSLPCEEMDDMSLRYSTFMREGKFVCEVNLPERAQISSIVGRPYPKKIEAKMSAAFEACKVLRKQKQLDDKWLPTITQHLHIMRNARIAIKSNKRHAYEAMLKPSMWAEDRGTSPTKLFVTVLRLDSAWERPVRPLALLTRRAIPQLPCFPLYPLQGEPALLVPTMHGTAIEVGASDLSQLTWFTLTMFKDVFAKEFEEDSANMTYWVAPVSSVESSHKNSELDWLLLSDMHRKSRIDWKPGMLESSLVNRYLLDPWNGGRRWFSKDIAHGRKAMDPVPENVAADTKGATTIVEYSSGLFKQSKARRTWDAGQPVIEAEKLSYRQNLLSPPSDRERHATRKCFLCPEPLGVSRLPADVAAMCLVFPSTIYRLENTLIALEFCDVLHLSVDPGRALEAVTKDSDNSEDVSAERLNFQEGMGPNYERLEFIGDTFLKMATTIATYLRNAGKDEFWMHADRLALLCNVNMFNNAQAHDYVRFIRSKAYSRRTWYPEGLKLLSGTGVKRTKHVEDQSMKQNLSEKTIADVCEAMIGASLVSHIHSGYEKPSDFDDAVKAVTAFVSSSEHHNHDMQCWDDYRKAHTMPKYYDKSCSASEIDVAQKVELIHPYHFSRPKLLISAFTHSSMPMTYARAPNYQRLEFLGDSLLDMASVKYLFNKYPEKDPHWLTEHKMAMVSNKFMAALGAKLGFNKYLEYHSGAIQHQLKVYTSEYNEAAREAGDSRGFWQTLGDAPKPLADMIESYVGAMFIDSDFDFAVVQKFFDDHVAWFFEDMEIYDEFANNHPINRLRSFLNVSMGCDRFALKAHEVISDDEHSSAVLAGVVVHSKVIGKAVAKTSRVAKIHAANNAYEELRGMPPFQFRQTFGCDCEAQQDLNGGGHTSGFESTAI